ncbi:hypothetical protein OK016_01260 [Vibrio chagasii]|nr:hypothetical protein [Vibrio chagasii]
MNIDLAQADDELFNDDDLAAIQDADIWLVPINSNPRSNGCWWRVRALQTQALLL